MARRCSGSCPCWATMPSSNAPTGCASIGRSGSEHSGAVRKVFRGVLPGIVILGLTCQPTLADGLKTDLGKALVPLDEIVSGGPPPDGIPAIDRPVFVATGAADSWIKPREPVLALEINGDARAYHLQILIWHEIVNDM